MSKSDHSDQYKRICCWCGLVSYLGIGMNHDEFRAELDKSKNKTKFKNEFEQQCRLVVKDYICKVGYDVFVEEVKKYHQTLPPEVKKRRPETYARWSGVIPDKELKERYNEYRRSCSDFYDGTSDLGISYDSWLKYCAGRS